MRAPYPRARRRFPVLRQSLLARFADCQLSAGGDLALTIERPRRRGQPSEPPALHTSGWTSHRAGAGRIAHATIARALRHMVARSEERIAKETVIDFLNIELRQAEGDVGDSFAVPAHEDRQLRKTLRKWARDNVITIADVYGIEERLEATITYPDGQGGTVERVLSGQLDLLLLTPDHRHATVPDWKDTWKLPAKRRADDDEEEDGEDDAISVEGYFQQVFYALLVFLNLPFIQSVTLREFYLRRSEPREATIWRHELPDIVAYLASLAEKFDRCYEAATEPEPGRKRRRKLRVTVAEWGEPSPGSHCSYCPIALDCPLGVEAREGGEVATPEQAEIVGGQLLVARRVATKLGKSLETWTDHFGPTRVRDAKRLRFFGHVTSTRTERPTLKALDAAILAGRDPRELYRSKTHTRFTTYTPDQDVTAELDDEDVAEMFERAAALAKQKRERRARV